MERKLHNFSERIDKDFEKQNVQHKVSIILSRRAEELHVLNERNHSET